MREGQKKQKKRRKVRATSEIRKKVAVFLCGTISLSYLALFFSCRFLMAESTSDLVRILWISYNRWPHTCLARGGPYCHRTAVYCCTPQHPSGSISYSEHQLFFRWFRQLTDPNTALLYCIPVYRNLTLLLLRLCCCAGHENMAGFCWLLCIGRRTVSY